MKPLNDNVAVLPEKQSSEKTTAGGIILTNKTNPLSKGIVRHVSADASSAVAVGDTVLYPTNAGAEVESDGETLLVIPIKSLKAIL